MTVVLSYVASTEGRGALAFGFTEAKLRSTDVLVIADGDSGSAPALDADLQSAREKADALGVQFRVATLDGKTTHADNLIDASYADEADVLVIGMRRRSPVGKLLMGSMVQRVLLEADCPVTAVKVPVGVV